MRNWLLPIAMFFPFFISGQVETSQFIPTNEVRNLRVFTRQEIIMFDTVREPGTFSPYLVVRVSRWISRQRIQERQYVDRNVLTTEQLQSLQLARLFNRNTSDIVQGLPEESVIWKRENEFLPPKYELNQEINLLITAKDSTWTFRTDNSGDVRINIDNLAHLSEGGLLQISVALEEKPYIREEYSFSSAIFAMGMYQGNISLAPNRMLLRETLAGRMTDSTTSIMLTYDAETEGSVEAPTLLSEGESERAPADITDRATPIRLTEASETGELTGTSFLPTGRDLVEPSVEKKVVIAVLDFDGYGVSQTEAQVLTNRLGTHLVQSGTHQVIERGQMEQILKEQNFQMTGCTSNECAVEIGRVLGCEQMLAGSFGKIGSIYTIDMRIIDVESGSILRTTSYDVRGDVENLLTEGLAGAVRRITGVE